MQQIAPLVQLGMPARTLPASQPYVHQGRSVLVHGVIALSVPLDTTVHRQPLGPCMHAPQGRTQQGVRLHARHAQAATTAPIPTRQYRLPVAPDGILLVPRAIALNVWRGNLAPMFTGRVSRIVLLAITLLQVRLHALRARLATTARIRTKMSLYLVLPGRTALA